MLLKAIISVLLFSSVTAAQAQTARPFKGAWYADGLYVDIDFYGKSISDPNSMDGDPCAGIIRIKPDDTSMAYTIENLKMSGNRATATAYFAEKDSRLSFEYMADGSLKMTSSDGFSYVDDEQKKLPQNSYVLHRASPFNGEWKLAKGDGTLRINLYYKSMYEENAEGGSEMCYGTIYVAYGNGMKVDNSLIRARKIEGNKAVIEYVGGRDGNTYRAVLVYNPSTRQITVKSPVSVGASGGVKESFVVDGMVFTRR